MLSVTQIVSEVYPFNSFWPKRDFFQESLSYEKLADKILVPDGIAHKCRHLHAPQTLRVLNSYGSFAHRMAKQLSNWEDIQINEPLLSNIRTHLIQFYTEYKVTPVMNEWTFTIPDEYSGTLDMVCELEWYWVKRLCVLDFKTYWLYKDIYGIPHVDKEKTVPKKMKHVTLQVSLYSNAVRLLRPEIVENRGVLLLLLWVTPEGVFPYELEEDIMPYEKWLARNFIS